MATCYFWVVVIVLVTYVKQSESVSTFDVLNSVELHIPAISRSPDGSQVISHQRKLVKREAGVFDGIYFPSLALINDNHLINNDDAVHSSYSSFRDEELTTPAFDMGMPASMFLLKEISLHPEDFGSDGARIQREILRNASYDDVSIGELLMAMEHEAYEDALG